MLRRLISPLLRAGWSEVDSETWYDDELEEASDRPVVGVELARADFHLIASWDAEAQELTLDDPTEGWDWEDGLPPLFALDEPLVVQLDANSSQAERTEVARRAFAAGGLLDVTRIHLPDGVSSSLRVGLMLLIVADRLHKPAEYYRGRQDAGEVIASFGEDFAWRISSGLRVMPLVIPTAVPSAAALGIAEWCWRRESDVENWHHKVGDLIMARANIAATRAVQPHVHLEGVDWPAVRLALTMPNRRLADDRALRTRR